MKRVFCVALAVTLFFSFAVVGQAAVYTDKYYPITSYGWNTTYADAEFVTSGAPVNGEPVYSNVTTTANKTWTYIYAWMKTYDGTQYKAPGHSHIWFVFDMQFMTAGNVNSGDIVEAIRATSATSYTGSQANEPIVTQYVSNTDDGRWLVQVLCEAPTSVATIYRMMLDVTVNTYTSTDTYIKTNAVYYQYADSASDTIPPLDPDDPYPSTPEEDGPMSPPTESDKWVSEQYTGAVNPNLSPKIEEAYGAAGQVESFENQMWDSLDQYSADVNPDNFEFDPQFISSMGWIAETWTACFNGLGSWQGIVTFPMFLGLAMLIIGRGASAVDRGVAKVQRRQMRDEYRRDRGVNDA